MSGFFNSIKSFVHSISTSDHYASYDPSRPSGQEDAAPLATSDADRRPSSSSLNSGTYIPGMRSAQMSSSSTNLAQGNNRRSSETGASRNDSIPLSDMGPIPSPELSWGRIDAWIESNYPELYDQLMEGATSNDLNDLEHDLDCLLPPDVRESLGVHDGQEPGGKPTGLIFGISLLDMESISEEWNVWRRTALKIEELAHRRRQNGTPKVASSSTAPRPAGGSRLGWVENQGSCPVDAVQPVYAHVGWIPLAKDFDGNNIGVDLAPGPKGRYGQVILFGREFDTKYVVAPSWGDFLAQFAADLESGQSYIDDDIENAVFAFKAPTGQLVSYFNVMRQRVERVQPKQQTSQRPSQPRTMSGHNASVSHAPVNSGRPTQRLISPTGSTTSLVSKDSRRPRTPSSLARHLNEVDLHGDATTPENLKTPEISLDTPKSAEETTMKSEVVKPSTAADSQPKEPKAEAKAEHNAEEKNAKSLESNKESGKPDSADVTKMSPFKEPTNEIAEESNKDLANKNDVAMGSKNDNAELSTGALEVSNDGNVEVSNDGPAEEADTDAVEKEDTLEPVRSQAEPTSESSDPPKLHKKKNKKKNKN